MWLLTKLARRQYIQISSYTLLPVTPIQADEWISARFRVKSPFQIAEDSYSRVCLFPLCTIPDNKGTNETLKWHHTLLRLEQLTFPKLAWCTRYLDLSGPDSIIHNFLPLLYSSDLFPYSEYSLCTLHDAQFKPGIWYDVVLNNQLLTHHLAFTLTVESLDHGRRHVRTISSSLSDVKTFTILGDTPCSCSATGQQDIRRARFRFAIIIGPEEAAGLKQLH